MWSIANEPRTQLADSEDYFKEVAFHTKALDRSRPITIALARGVSVSLQSIIRNPTVTPMKSKGNYNGFPHEFTSVPLRFPYGFVHNILTHVPACDSGT